MKTIRKLLALIFVCTILIPTSNYAYADEKIICADDGFFPNESVSIYNNDEGKIICKASPDDDYVDDTVLVVLKHKDSMELLDYNTTSFTQINGIASVEVLTKHEKERIKNDFLEKRDEYINRIGDMNEAEARAIAERKAIDDIEIENHRYRTILKIKLNVNDKQNVLDTIKELEKRDDVFSAEPAYFTYLTSIPNDYDSNEQWAPSNMNLLSAWNVTTGSRDVLVGVLDTGIMGSHPDLQANIYPNSNYHKSYVDNSPLTDNDGHGTHVAGIIGAVGNNGIGVTGVNWKVSLVSFKISSNGNSDWSFFISALDDANDLGIELLNYSFNGRPGSLNAVKQAISTYNGLIICSAGNGDDSNPENLGVDLDANPNNATSNLYLSLFDSTNIISVASINHNNEKADSSCYGKTSVDIAAPGVNIYSTKNDGTYYSLSGTSMATPQVTGVAALIKSACSGISPMGIKRAIMDNSTTCTSVNGKVVTDGKLNAYNALSSAMQSLSSISYTIQYNKGNGTGTNMSSQNTYFGAKATLAPCSFTKVGYKFIGWYAKNSSNKWEFLKPDGTIEWRNSTNSCSTSTIHLYPNLADYMDGVSTITRNNGTTITMVAQYEPIEYKALYDMSEITNPSIPASNQTHALYDHIYYIPTNENAIHNTSNQLGIVVNYCLYRYRNGNKEWLCTVSGSNVWLTENLCGEKVSFSRGEAYQNLSTLNGDVVQFYPNWTLLGDVDNSGSLTILDATLIQRYLVHLYTISDDMLPVADFDEDGHVTILDATAIQIYLSEN